MLLKTLIPLLLAAAASAQQVEIKMATLAPEGSPWHKVLERIGERWRGISAGKVRLKIFAGGTLGDEPDLVNKMRIDQIQAVALSGAGMSDLEPGVMALQTPMMIDSYPELDYVRDRVAPRLEKMIEARGYLVLNWGDAGWVHIFSRTPINNINDLRRMKLFVWAGSNDEIELWKANNFRPVALAATDILMGLETGLIDAVPTTPLYALWNQCFGRARYMNDLKWAPLVGATVVSKSAWGKIPESQRAPMLKAARDAGEELRSGIRSMGDAAIETMRAGQPGKRDVRLTITHCDAAALAAWRQETEAAYPKMRGKLIPADLFDEVRRVRDEYRARPRATP
jgi:TRAP-type C4-dicarboxylate transport system substrate-binding protein